MVVSCIIEGRQRAMEVLNHINPEDGEILYGHRHGGVGFCSFIFTKDGNDYVATVRTANRHFVKMDGRMLETNIAAAEDRELEHVLIVCFDWFGEKSMFLVKNCKDYIHHETVGRKYKVFVREHLESILKNGNPEVIAI